ncbi:MAG: undecaprenyl-diphosphate phosphatase [Longimicrobiales bacterium]
MSIIDAIVLGLIQGLAEFLPISSSGHLVVGQELLGVDAPGIVLEVVLHFATLLSIIVVYWSSLLRLARGLFSGDRRELGYLGMIAAATVPAGIVGLSLKGPIEAAFDTPAVTGVALLVTGLILWSTRWVPGFGMYGKQRAAPVDRELPDELDVPGESPRAEAPGWGLAFVIGVAQAFAILPGISRSGTTITTALWGRMGGASAAEFSFLMSIPAVAGANILELADVGTSFEQIGMTPLVFGFVTSLVSGIFAIKALVWLLRRQEFYRFSFYLWPIGTLFLLYLWQR